ncbi:hypothetical protein KDL01_35525 [Actinospica durhamensis]|uniref:Phospholipase n=1 Tax=Actinospica durhamensis TaxID=1508375 RepID=A0A941IV65_9ACTN|nr:hypothetical protein [Actinospica durhamensis]MBR7838633.1 hypothetical protein [Actinospica durhamensis]
MTTGHDHRYGPSSAASVVLNLGEDIGALVIEADESLLGVEIEISPLPRGEEAPVRTHSMVRQRLTRPEPTYDAVYPDLKEGGYTIWSGPDTAAATVEISGGRITRHRYTGAVSA